jgi:hypothetical protein
LWDVTIGDYYKGNFIAGVICTQNATSAAEPVLSSAKHRINDILPQVMESNKEEEPEQHQWEQLEPAFKVSPVLLTFNLPGSDDEGNHAGHLEHLVR